MSREVAHSLEHFDEVIHIIDNARSRAMKAVNAELIQMYWEIGSYVSGRVKDGGWRKSVVADFSEFLQAHYPGTKGFSAQNIWRMKQFYETYCDNEKLSPLVREIPWTSNLLIMTGCKTDEAREFYLRLCIANRYTKRELDRQIGSMLYERTMISHEKHKDLLAGHGGLAALRDSYVFEFLELEEPYKGKDLRRQIVSHLKDFILEFGHDFTFVGEEYRVQVGNTDFFIDLLFYNRALSCLVAIAEEDDDSKEEAKSYRFGFSCITMENPYYITLEQALREAVEAQGSTLVTKDPALNVDTQIEQIHQMIKDGLDAIFLCPVSRDAITPALEELKEADVKIINIDTEVKDTDYIDAYIGSDNKAAGQLCGEDLIQQSPDGGKIVILEGLTQNSIVERITGFEEAIAGKGFEIVGRADVSGDLNEAREASNKIFAENKDVTAVMCGNDQIALGALVAARTAGLTDVKIYGVDGSPDLKKELQKTDSLIRGTSAQSPIKLGKESAKIGFAILNGDDYEKTTYLDVCFIDASNVDMYGVDGWQ